MIPDYFSNGAQWVMLYHGVIADGWFIVWGNGAAIDHLYTESFDHARWTFEKYRERIVG